ncbi:MAG: [FeFe] hydrogenase H-cluster radical SAM maturase HydE [Bacteroidetes bacterium]|nr:[FeFe] hydrogenase H-cluster radical SAM maturase HydE [Bacteroidota bacterium]
MDNLKSAESIKSFLQGKDDKALFAEANRVREQVFGNEVYLRGVIEFTNFCKQNCNYCGLRAQNREISRYRITKEELLDSVKEAISHGLKTIVLQGGEDPFYTAEWFADVVSEIKRDNIAVTLSLGEQPYDALKLWRDAGADRYLIRIEEFNDSIYMNARPGHMWQERFKVLDDLRQLGYEVGSGFMVGLPGSSLDDLANSILKISKLDLHMIGIGPFIAHPQTPFYNEINGDIDLSLRTLALVRILNPYANMPSTSALESASVGARIKGMQVGCNVMMPSITPTRVKKLYNIYPGKNPKEDSIKFAIENIKQMVKDAGYDSSDSIGCSPKLKLENPV